MFVGFYVDHYDDDDRQPICAERSRAEAQAVAIRRVLGLGITSGGIAVVEQHNLGEEAFATLKRLCDEAAAKRGLPA